MPAWSAAKLVLRLLPLMRLFGRLPAAIGHMRGY